MSRSARPSNPERGPERSERVDKIGNLACDAEEALDKMEQWLDRMKDSPMGADINKLMNFDAIALKRVLLIAVMSYKKFVQ